MIGWIILAIYLSGYLLTWRRVVWALIEDVTYGKPDGADIVCAMVLGSMANCIWPLIVVGLAVRAVYRKREGDALYALMPRDVRRERELDDRERRIRELELANGMDPMTGKFRERSVA